MRGMEQVREQPQQNKKCPRCDSFNTKFCYFNNYSLSQPRHFCKTCKRYWTQGGTFRNIPIGGASRKAKRPRTTTTTTTTSSSSLSSSLSLNYPRPHQTQQLHLTVPSPPPSMVRSTALAGSGYLSSLNPSQPLMPFSGSLKAVAGSPDLSLVPGLNAASLSPRFYQIGNRERVNSVFPSKQGLLPSSVGNNDNTSSSVVMNNSHSGRWTQILANNNAVNQRVAMWSTMGVNSEQNNVRVGSSSSSSFNPNLVPGYGPR